MRGATAGRLNVANKITVLDAAWRLFVCDQNDSMRDSCGTFWRMDTHNFKHEE